MYCRDQARTLLNALGEGNPVRVRELLSRPGDGIGARTADEQEWNELLDGIRAGLAGHDVQSDEPAVTVSLRLLRHVAACCN
jgi:hypothetical protein